MTSTTAKRALNKLKLSEKLSSPWNAERLTSILNKDNLSLIQSEWPQLDDSVKLGVLSSFLAFRKADFAAVRSYVEDILSYAVFSDRNEWVQMLAQLLQPILLQDEAAGIESMAPATPIFNDSLNELRTQLEQCGFPMFVPLHASFLEPGQMPEWARVKTNIAPESQGSVPNANAFNLGSDVLHCGLSEAGKRRKNGLIQQEQRAQLQAQSQNQRQAHTLSSALASKDRGRQSLSLSAASPAKTVGGVSFLTSSSARAKAAKRRSEYEPNHGGYGRGGGVGVGDVNMNMSMSLAPVPKHAPFERVSTVKQLSLKEEESIRAAAKDKSKKVSKQMAMFLKRKSVKPPVVRTPVKRARPAVPTAPVVAPVEPTAATTTTTTTMVTSIESVKVVDTPTTVPVVADADPGPAVSAAPKGMEDEEKKAEGSAEVDIMPTPVVLPPLVHQEADAMEEDYDNPGVVEAEREEKEEKEEEEKKEEEEERKREEAIAKFLPVVASPPCELESPEPPEEGLEMPDNVDPKLKNIVDSSSMLEDDHRRLIVLFFKEKLSELPDRLKHLTANEEAKIPVAEERAPVEGTNNTSVRTMYLILNFRSGQWKLMRKKKTIKLIG